MTNEEALWIALSQSAIDHGCRPEDFLSGQNKAVPSRNSPDARRYLRRPQALELTSYGANAVASASPELMEAAKAYVDRYPAVHCFQTPQLLVLSRWLRPFGKELCFMGEYFLPDLDKLRGLDCGLCCRTLEREQLASLSAQLWPNALSQDAREWDVLGVGAYEGERLVGLAACSADCKTMWQIGVDVLPAYRRRGVASALTSRLALEVLERGALPFYCCAWSNLASIRNALRSGFRPAWVQLSAAERSFTDQLAR